MQHSMYSMAYSLRDMLFDRIDRIPMYRLLKL